MAVAGEIILGEFTRSLDDRYRLSLPAELVEKLTSGEEAGLVLAKERAGCLSLWRAADWTNQLESGLAIVRQKLLAGKLQGRTAQVQLLGRLLSTRHRDVQITGRGRLLVPEGFREFLQVEPGGELMVVGAAVCVEIWNPAAWLSYLEGRMPKFRRLFEKLTE